MISKVGGICWLPGGCISTERSTHIGNHLCSRTASSSSTEVDCITPPVRKQWNEDLAPHGFCGVFQGETIWTVSWRKWIAEILFRKKSNRLIVGFYILQAVPWISSIKSQISVLGWCWNFEKMIISWKKHWSISMVLLCVGLAPTVSRGHQFRLLPWLDQGFIFCTHETTLHTIQYPALQTTTVYPSQMLKQKKNIIPKKPTQQNKFYN